MTNHRARQLIRRGAWLVFPLVAALFFLKPIVHGEVLVPGDILAHADDVWASSAKANNPLLSDVVLQFYPWQKFTFKALRSGVIPLWNPYVLNGAPFLANDQSAIFDPLKLLIFALGFPAANSFLPLAILRLGLFGLFTWLFLCQRGIDSSVSWAVGLVAVFAAPMIAWVSYPLAATFVWFPLILYATDRVLKNQRAGLIILAAAIAAQSFSGNIQITLYEMLAVLFYVLYTHRPFNYRRVVIWLAGVALGFSLAAVQLFPTITFLSQSQQSDTGRRGYAEATWGDVIKPQAWLSWTSLGEIKENFYSVAPIVFPFINGNPVFGNYRYPGQNPLNNFNELAGSVGFVGFLLALYGLRPAWRDRFGKYVAILTGSCIGIIAHAPIFELFNYLPLINLTTTGRLRFIIAFGLLILAAYGLRELWQNDGRRNKRIILLSIISAGVYALVSWKLSPYGFRLTDFLVVLLSIAAINVAFRLRKNFWRGAIIFAAIAAQPAIMLFNYNTSVKTNVLYSENSAIQIIARAASVNSRVVGLSSDGARVPLAPNASMVFGFHDARGYEVVRSRRFDELAAGVLLHSGSSINRIEKYSPLLEVFGVTNVLVNSADNAALKTLPQNSNLAGTADSLSIYSLKTSDGAPVYRAFVVNTITVAATPEESLTLTQHRKSGDKPVIENAENIPADKLIITPAQISSENENNISITANSKTGGYLILSDTFDPGWKAWVDGQPAKIYVANHAFRAVQISAGAHTVKFSYTPKSFVIGAAITTLSALAMIFWGIVEIFRTRKRNKKASVTAAPSMLQ